MRDRLENFVMGHRDQFDFREPNPNTWSRIDQRLNFELTQANELENFVNTHRAQFDNQFPNSTVWSQIEQRISLPGDKSSPIEHFVKDNIDQFNTKVPSLKVWSKINQQLQPQKTARRISFLRMVKYAACVIFLLGIGAKAGIYFSQINNNGMDSLGEIAPEYAEMEQYYQKQIDSKHAQLANYDYDTRVNEDLSQVDDILKELRTELIDTPKGSEEQIVDAMIQNYKTKIAILEIVLEKIKSTNQQKEEKNEAISM